MIIRPLVLHASGHVNRPRSRELRQSGRRDCPDARRHVVVLLSRRANGTRPERILAHRASASSPTEKGITGAADASTGSLGFTDGAALYATDELFWAISTSTLSEHGFELDAANSSIANGRWTFRAGDGSVLTALQQRVTDLDSTATDEDATRQVIVASHVIDDPPPATLARQGGGTVEALGGDRAPDADGRSVGALSRSFARTGINLSILAEAPSPARLTEGLAVAAQSLEVGFQTGG